VTELVLNRWQIDNQIGEGGFGRVFEATDGTESAVVKLVKKLPGASRELLIGGDFSGAVNVIPIIDSGETDTDWVLVMPRAETSLASYLQSNGPLLDQADAISILTDVAMALESLEGKVVRRDLKPGNILRYQSRWCLADFGIARYAEATTAPDTQKYAMTPQYAAPEQWRHERATTSTDVYAFGVVAFEILSGRLPFPGPSFEDFRQQHLHDNPPTLPGAPPLLAGLIGECLIPAPQARPRPANIVRRLQGITPSTPSPALQRLQEASLAETERQAEAERHKSAARSAEENRTRLAGAARASLTQISTVLRDTIRDAAPNAQLAGTGTAWSITLGDARLSFGEMTPTAGNPWGTWQPEVPRGLDVIASASLTLQIPPMLDGWAGRSHSLWFCNYADRTEYGWFEGAFMHTSFVQPRSRRSQLPFTMAPSEDAAKAISNVISEFQLAKRFERLIVGDLDEFIHRWVEWLADAADRKLQPPSRLPER
jgi:hypothetical protein